MSKLETNTIDTVSGTTNLTIGSTNSSTVTFENGAVTGHMYPAFEAYLSAGQSISDNSVTKVQLNTEVFDTDNCYDNTTNYRFTPTVAGKYFVYLRTTIDCTTGEAKLIASNIYKNGSSIVFARIDFDRGTANQEGEGGTPVCSAIVDMNGTSDYLEGFARADTNDGSSSNVQGDSTERLTNFGAYRIGS